MARLRLSVHHLSSEARGFVTPAESKRPWREPQHLPANFKARTGFVEVCRGERGRADE